LQPGLEDAFAAAVEVVAVDEGEHGLVGGYGQKTVQIYSILKRKVPTFIPH
jgi:hypothetical protein